MCPALMEKRKMTLLINAQPVPASCLNRAKIGGFLSHARE